MSYISTETMKASIKQGEYYEQERQRNFANPPKNCRHELVYHKEGDNIHCHYCDKFLYRADQD